MEKIAIKNTQGGGANTYELAYDTPRQLIASYSQFDEIKENEGVALNLTSQERILLPLMPFNIALLNIALQFSQGNGQNMRLIVVGASIAKNFNAPIGDNNIVIPFDNDIWGQDVPLRMDVLNLETTQILPQPVLRAWCLTYNIPTP